MIRMWYNFIFNHLSQKTFGSKNFVVCTFQLKNAEQNVKFHNNAQILFVDKFFSLLDPLESVNLHFTLIKGKVLPFRQFSTDFAAVLKKPR